MELASNRRLTFSRDAHHVPWVTFAINLGGSFLLRVRRRRARCASARDVAPGPHDRAARRLHDVLNPLARDLPAARVLVEGLAAGLAGGDARRLRGTRRRLGPRGGLAPALQVSQAD